MANNKWKKINDYYAKHTVRDKIMDIQVRGTSLGEDYKQSIYEKYNITRISKHDFMERARDTIVRSVREEYKDTLKQIAFRKNKEKFINNKVEEELNKRWEEYEHRDKLIETGQYDKFRIQDYREKFINVLKEMNIDENIIYTLEKLSNEKLSALISQPNTQRDDNQKRKLPTLGWYYPSKDGNASDDIIAKTENEILEAFKALDIKVRDKAREEEAFEDNYYNDYNPRELSPEEEEYIDVVYQTVPVNSQTPTARALKRLGRDYRPLNDKNISTYEVYDAIITKYRARPESIKITKKGDIYIPFVGSSRSGTKNENFMRTLRTYMRRRNIEI